MNDLKVTAVLLLLVQAFHPASLQESTDSPGRTIDKSWLRQKPKITADGENAAFPEEENENSRGTDAPHFTNDFNDGVASGFMAVDSEEERNLFRQDQGENETSEDLNIVRTTPNPASENGTTERPEVLDATIPPSTSTSISSNYSQINETQAEEELNATATTDNSTSVPVFSNHTERWTTSAPENISTEESSTAAGAEAGPTNQTGPSNTTTAPATTAPATAAPEINQASTTSSSTTALPSETSETIALTTTAALPNTPERANKTGKGAASSSGKDFDSDPYRSKRSVAWVAVLGTAAAMACVGLVAYIVLKKKHQKGFTHRKLVEEYPSDPVLRLDNSEPLDLNFGGSAYYNPGVQGDSIQMNNFPGHR